MIPGSSLSTKMCTEARFQIHVFDIRCISLLVELYHVYKNAVSVSCVDFLFIKVPLPHQKLACTSSGPIYMK